MARNKKPIGVVRPGIVVGAGPGVLGPGPGFRRPVVPGRDAVWIYSDTPLIDVVARLTGKPSSALPRPRYDTVERGGTIALTRYRGHDPHELTLPILLERSGRSVEREIDDLEQLARRHPESANEPPIVRVQGPGIPHQNLRWRLTFPDAPDRVEYNEAQDRVRFGVTVTLIEDVGDALLAETLRRGRSAQGIRANRTTRVRDGEDLHDIARRMYGDPSRATDIARANANIGLRLGARLRTGLEIRIP